MDQVVQFLMSQSVAQDFDRLLALSLEEPLGTLGDRADEAA